MLFPVYLVDLGLDARGVGLAVTGTLLSSALLTAAVRRPADRFGLRPALLGLAGLGVLSALLLLGSARAGVVIAAAMLGNLAVGTGETGPFLTLEQVVLARATSRARLTATLSLYNLSGYVAAAVGAAVVGLAVASPPALFAAFLAGGLVQLAAYAGLSAHRPEAPAPDGPAPAGPPPASSRPLVRRLAALFALDSFAGGFVLQSLVAYWLHTRFALDLAALGQVFFAAQLLSGLSLLLAAGLARRLGLVNTMVWTHLASNVFLVGMALAPTAAVAVGLLLARQALSQIDVPTRQAFMMLAVADPERAHAASLTNTARTVAQAVSPAVTGWIMQGLALSAPLVLGGVLKSVYDLLLYATIRSVRLR